MRLSEFVREALTDIAFGVHEAKVDSQTLVAIVPGSLGGVTQLEKSYIEFDIAVTAESSSSSTGKKEGGGHAGINVFSAKIGADAKASSENENSARDETVSRVSFKIPIFFNAHFRTDVSAAAEREFVKAAVKERFNETL